MMDARSLTSAELASIGPHSPMEAAAKLLAANPSQFARVLLAQHGYAKAMRLLYLMEEHIGAMR